MWFTSLVFKNVWRRKVRSLLTCTSMAIAVCAVLSMLGTAEGYERSFAKLFEARGTDLVVIQAGKAQRSNSLLDQGLAERIQAIDGVDAVEGTLVDLYQFPDGSFVYIYGLDPKSRIIENAKKEEGGGTLVPTDRRKVAMGNSLARKLDKKVGDKVELTGGFEFEIIGIFESNNLLESNGAVMPIAEMQEILNQPNKVTTMLIILKQSHKAPEKVALVKSQIEALRDPAGKSLNIDVQSTRDHVSTNMETQALKGLAWAASLIAILIGFVSMLNTMMMSIAERIREIATFRAIGWRKWRIMRMIFMESLILSIVGAVVGVLLAIPLMEFLANFSMTSSLVTSKLTLETLAKGIGMGLIAGFLGSVYPAFIAANLSPASALRHE